LLAAESPRLVTVSPSAARPLETDVPPQVDIAVI
jgi:hypothetical protein